MRKHILKAEHITSYQFISNCVRIIRFEADIKHIQYISQTGLRGLFIGPKAVKKKSCITLEILISGSNIECLNSNINPDEKWIIRRIIKSIDTKMLTLPERAMKQNLSGKVIINKKRETICI